MRRLLSISLLTLTALGCDRTPTAPREGSEPQAAISDGANLGNQHFYFLPPVVKMPSYSGSFDGSLAPAVSICEWDTLGNKCGPVVAEFGSGGTGDGTVATDLMGENYHVNWKTDQCLSGPCALDPLKTYRIRVFVGLAQLGFADVDVVSSGSQLKNVQTGEFIGLVDGRTLPIKFRIERGAVAVLAPGGSAQVGVSGGLVTSGDGQVAMSIPDGALAATTPITVAPVSPAPEGSEPWAQVSDLGPTGTSFSIPVTLTLAYDPQRLPEGVPPSALAIYHFDGTGWEIVPGSSVDEVDNTVSAPISHFSYYWVGIRPNEVKWNGAPADLVVGRSTTVTALIGYCVQIFYSPTSWTCQNYPVRNYAVNWSTTNPAVMTVPTTVTRTDVNGTAVSPPITGRSPGNAAISASTVVGNRGLVLTVLGQLGLLPRTANNVAGWNVRQNITQSVAIPTDLAVSLRNVNSFLTINEGGTANYTYGGQTGSYTIFAGQTEKLLGVAGLNGVGVDTLIASSAGFVPDTAVITLVKGKFLVSGWPATIQAGDSAALQVTLTDQAGGLGGLAVPITLELTGSPGLVFRSGNASITTIAVQQRTSATFYVIATASGSQSVSISHRDYLTYTNSLSATPPPRIALLPGDQTIPAWMGRGEHITLAHPLATELSVSITNVNGILQLADPGTGNSVYGGQTGIFVMPAGTTSRDVNIYGFGGVGVDTIIATAAGFSPDTAIVTVVPATLIVTGWPATLLTGDSAAITVTVANQNNVPDALGYAVTFALASSGGLTFSNGQAPITSMEVQQYSTTFYVKAVSAGLRSMTISHRDFVPYSHTLTVTPPPSLNLVPGNQTIPAWLGRGEQFTIPAPLGANLNVSVTNQSGILVLYESGTANTVYGGQTGTFVIPAGATAKSMNMFGTVGVGTIIVAAPGFAADTAVVTVVPATLRITGWPATLALGDSVAIQVSVADQNGVLGSLGYATTFALAGSGGLVFSNGQAAITSIGIQQYSTTFWMRAVAPGPSALTITHPDFVTYTNSVAVTAPPFYLQSIDAAGGFTCATTVQNEAYCWGSNGNVGTLGLGITNNSNYPTPMKVSGGYSFTTVSTDAGHTCGLTPAGAAYCWGYGSDTRLGTGIDAGSNLPVAVAGGHVFVQIDVGDNHACAVDNQQRAYCWGYGMLGNLANTANPGSRGNSSVPTLVLGGLQFLRVAAGGNFSCGIATDQTAYCWGLNTVGQLGAPSPTTYNCDPYACSLTPTAVSGGLQFQAITAGTQHVCAVTLSGAVHCWGGNGDGQLGDGTNTNRPAPVQVGGVNGATQVDAGAGHTCARTGTGQIYCWGANAFGQLGRGTQIGSPTAGLVSASGLSFSRVTAGGSHSCAITTVGSAYCWGANASGQLGLGSVTAPRLVPTLVANP